MDFDPKEIVYVSWDPGEHIGYACWDSTGKPVKIGSLHGDEELDEFLRWLTKYAEEITVFIIEDYKVYGHKVKAHIGSRVKTAKVIGHLESYARLHSVSRVLQPARILPIAEKWSGVVVSKDRATRDFKSAYNHGYYYLHKLGLIKARVLDAERDNST